jgi:hypothetical protein
MNIQNLIKTSAKIENITESEIEQLIIKSPGNLMLGDDIKIIKSQTKQFYGNGILDILALDSINNIYYEIEIMLGQIDSRHIGNILDYWAKEKSNKLYSDHIAIIICESIRGRYQKLLSVLPDYVPIICGEFTIYKNGKDLFFNYEPIYYPSNLEFKKFENKFKSNKMISKQSLIFMQKIIEMPSILKENRRHLAEFTGVSLGSTCKFIKNLQDMNYLDKELNIINLKDLKEHTNHVSYILSK